MPLGIPALRRARACHSDTVALRRWFHERPEPSRREFETSSRIKAELDKLDVQYDKAGNTSLVATIAGKARSANPRAVVALRADIDALEIKEANEVPYRSRNDGLMHACGHDGHIASLLAAARLLKEDEGSLSGTVKLIFQSAEEIGEGAQEIVESGLVDDVGAFFAIHVTPRIPAGAISLRSGPIMAGANSLRIVLEGKSSHGARPDLGIDAVVAGSAIVQALQEIVAREADPIEPAVITVGTFNAGTRANIIANHAILTGTVRVLSEEKREKMAAAVKRIAINVATAYRVNATVDCEYATPIVINSPELYPIVRDAACAVVGDDAVLPQEIEMGTDDFARYSTIAPAFYSKVGVAGSGEIFGLHHERFDLDESALDVMAALHLAVVDQSMRSLFH